MPVNFDGVPHPRIAERRKAGPPQRSDEQVGFNGRFALLITTVVDDYLKTIPDARAEPMVRELDRTIRKAHVGRHPDTLEKHLARERRPVQLPPAEDLDAHQAMRRSAPAISRPGLVRGQVTARAPTKRR